MAASGLDVVGRGREAPVLSVAARTTMDVPLTVTERAESNVWSVIWTEMPFPPGPPSLPTR